MARSGCGQGLVAWVGSCWRVLAVAGATGWRAGRLPWRWPRLRGGLAGEGSIVAPGTWKWLAGVVPTARRGLDLLPGGYGTEVMVAAGVTAAVRRCCGSRAAGCGAAG